MSSKSNVNEGVEPRDSYRGGRGFCRHLGWFHPSLNHSYHHDQFDTKSIIIITDFIMFTIIVRFKT